MNISKIREISDIYKENIAALIGGKPYYIEGSEYLITEIKYEITKKYIVFFENRISLQKNGDVTWHERMKFPIETAENEIQSCNSAIESVLKKKNAETN